jgi:predicted alpha-1,2-mannosidase
MNICQLSLVVKRISFAFLLLCTAPVLAQDNLGYVDPTIGGVGIILEPTKPTVHLPNSMVRMSPCRKDMLDDQINYFPLTISSHRQNNLFGIMPFSGAIDSTSAKRSFAYDNEKVTPYSYSSVLDDHNTGIRFSPTARCGYFTFSFRDHLKHYLRFCTINKGGHINVQGKRAISGVEEIQGMKAYFYAELDKDMVENELNDNGTKKAVFIGLSQKDTVISVRYGISFISVEKAKANLARELPHWDMSAVMANAKSAWQKVMSQIDVTGGTNAQKKVFYTALYRCYERMVDISEYGEYYSGYDHKIHRSDQPFYADNWIWDTYIAMEPLITILDPQLQNHKIRSYIDMYRQSGWMPSFALIYGEADFMTGNHAAAWIADAWYKGVRNYDIKEAYAGLKKNSLQGTLLPWRTGAATSLDVFYNNNGYMPSLKPGEKETVKEVHPFERRQAVAVTLDNSYDDWCVAQLAGPAGKKDEAAMFLKRAANYKNVYRTDKGFMWPKDKDGEWIEPFDPKFSGGQGGRDYFTENNAYIYNWDVRHDLSKLIGLMGGRESTEAKLDELFRAPIGRSKYDLWYTFPDATGLVGQFVMGNEPSFHIPYIYNYVGAPWKTQKRIRMLLDAWFTDGLFGIPGDEDGGGMSAFVVFSMMGFFPVTPGLPVYNMGSPVFNSISIKLPDGKVFKVNAAGNSSSNKYIQQATLNGQPLIKPWFTHADLLNGGTIDLKMGSVPNKTWGADTACAPPSAMDIDPNIK